MNYIKISGQFIGLTPHLSIWSIILFWKFKKNTYSLNKNAIIRESKLQVKFSKIRGTFYSIRKYL